VLIAGGLAVCSGGLRPAVAGPRAPFVIGDYFGLLTAVSGNRNAIELNIGVQDGTRIGGVLNIGGRFQDVFVTGTVTRRKISVRGKSGQGRNAVQINIDADLNAPGPEQDATIDGGYRLSGGVRERGLIALNGRVGPLPEPEFRP
jgi:hypothetical protein